MDERETAGQVTSSPEDGNPFHKKQQIAVGAGAERPARTPKVFNDAEAERFLNYLSQERKKKKLKKRLILSESIDKLIDAWIRKKVEKK